MLKKAGLVTVGVSAALLAASPMAFAGNSTDPADSGQGHHKSHESHGGHDKQHGVGNTSCASESGDTKGNDTEGILALGPVLNGNSGQILSCNSFLNHNLNHNLNDFSLDIG